MRVLTIFFIAITCLASGCGQSRDLAAARAALSSTDRQLVRSLSKADIARAAEIRSQLSTSSSPQFAPFIAEGSVVADMLAADVLKAWGEPDRAWRPWLLTTGFSEYWEYSRDSRPNLSVSLSHGMVVGVQFESYASNPTPKVLQSPNGGYLKQWPSREAFGYRTWRDD